MLLGACSGACATTRCEALVKDDASPAELEAVAHEQAQCEQRKARMRRSFDAQHEEDEAAQRRDAFRGRSDAKAHGH